MLYRFLILLTLVSPYLTNTTSQAFVPPSSGFCSTPELQDAVIKEALKKHPASALAIMAYGQLSAALATNDVSAVQKLLTETPGLKNYALDHEDGTPLHYVRSLAMAQLLVETFGFDVNVCDQWGQLPSAAIRATNDQFFAQKEEKEAIAHYFSAREARFAKTYYQLARNQNIHRTLCVIGLTTLILALDMYLIASGNQHNTPYRPVKK